MIDFLDRFVKAAGLQRFAIAGNSLGGQYAWRFALRHPERVSALILIDAAGYPMRLEGPGTLGLRLARMPVISDLLRLAPVEGFTRSGLLAVYGDRSRVGDELITRHAELMLRPGNRAALSARARSVDPHDESWRQLPRITAPTLVMWGERDSWITPEFGRRFTGDIPGAQLLIYPDLGHVPMEEDPARTARDAAAFLRSKGVSR
jgi:pimeloyl-ACP methyl ester carboxylesterase